MSATRKEVHLPRFEDLRNGVTTFALTVLLDALLVDTRTRSIEEFVKEAVDVVERLIVVDRHVEQGRDYKVRIECEEIRVGLNQ
jgi:hypothetical protein